MKAIADFAETVQGTLNCFHEDIGNLESRVEVIERTLGEILKKLDRLEGDNR